MIDIKDDPIELAKLAMEFLTYQWALSGCHALRKTQHASDLSDINYCKQPFYIAIAKRDVTGYTELLISLLETQSDRNHGYDVPVLVVNISNTIYTTALYKPGQWVKHFRELVESVKHQNFQPIEDAKFFNA